VALLQDQPGEPETLGTELIKARPDDETFEPRLKAQLRRHVVERCIYAVDLDPLAVELCRLALWVESMDRDLPFSFLDHKIKCGNGLVGAWFDQFQHYPVMAWAGRDAGDGNHSNGVHFKKDSWTKELNAFVSDKLKADLQIFLEGRTLFDADLQSMAADTHKAALKVLGRIHDLGAHESAERARIYKEEVVGSEGVKELRRAMDLWCACWFWPAEALAHAPLPASFHDPSEETRNWCSLIQQRERFFHWELEFPDVFTGPGSGFDAVVGNPPWDIAKPNSKEFFSSLDPLFRSYGKTEAKDHIRSYFEADKEIEANWLDYNARFKAQSQFIKHAAFPFGDPESVKHGGEAFAIPRVGAGSDALHEKWRKARAKDSGYADPKHPYKYQGSADINLFKTFLEQGHALLTQDGRLGMIVPSGIYSDDGTQALRRLFLDECRWQWLFGFENREGIFEAVDSRAKFNPLIVQKGGTTHAILATFMRRELTDWERAEELARPYSKEQVLHFSPESLALVEVIDDREVQITDRLYSSIELLGERDSEGIRFAQYKSEFHMTSDSDLFPARARWEEWGYQPDEYSRWIKGPWKQVQELAEVKQARGHAPGQVEPHYAQLPCKRTDLPAGLVLSRDGTQYIRENEIPHVQFTLANGSPLKVKAGKGRGKKKEEPKPVEGKAIAVPLWQGVMLWDWSHNAAGYLSGAGHRAKWGRYEDVRPEVNPQFLMAQACPRKSDHKAVMAFRALSNATNERTFVTAYVDGVRCGNSVGLLDLNSTEDQLHFGVAVSGSFAFDWLLRRRIVGTNVNSFFLWEVGWPNASKTLRRALADLNRMLCLVGVRMAPQALHLESVLPWRKTWAMTTHERQRVKALIHAISAAAYGLDLDDMRHILKDCDHPVERITNRAFARALDPKAFWRVEKEQDAELRSTVLAFVAFHDLEERIAAYGGDRDKGIEAFLCQNNGEGWLLPETLRLADYGLGHDERAKEHQPVASRMGPRYYDWQLAQSPEESWKECHLHARNLLGAEGYAQLLERIEAEKRGEVWQPSVVEEPAAEYGGNENEQLGLDL